MSPYKGKYCTKRDAQGHCLKCISGLDLIGKECVKTKLVGCIKKESNNQKCAVCGTGHVLRSHKCDKNKEGCAIEDAVKGCQKCLGDYHLEGSKCVPNSIDQNCKHSTDNGCYKCKDGYYLTKDRKCVPNEPKCLFYQKTQCTLCKRVYTLKDGSCELTNCTVPGLPGTGCKVCKYPYFPYNGRCSLSYCNEVGPNDQCDVCSSGGRRIKNHKCEKEPLLECAPCTHNYIFKDGDCVESGI